DDGADGITVTLIEETAMRINWKKKLCDGPAIEFAILVLLVVLGTVFVFSEIVGSAYEIMPPLERAVPATTAVAD
ncbi:MAG: hypothetical protein Q7S15_01915, partial [bacterium]|nr:hypothetical protein [bacterium]